jgi:hypothetical protein
MVFVPPPNTLILADRTPPKPPTEPQPETQPEDPWAEVARAASQEQATGRTCPVCHTIIVLTEHDEVKVHFAKPTDARPCPKSYKKL